MIEISIDFGYFNIDEQSKFHALTVQLSIKNFYYLGAIYNGTIIPPSKRLLYLHDLSNEPHHGKTCFLHMLKQGADQDSYHDNMSM